MSTFAAVHVQKMYSKKYLYTVLGKLVIGRLLVPYFFGLVIYKVVFGFT